jgi:hypothetical protein
MINDQVIQDPVLLYNTIIHDIMINNPMLDEDLYDNPNITFHFHPMYEDQDAISEDIYNIDAEAITAMEQRLPEIMVAKVLSYIDPRVANVYYHIRCLNQKMSNYDKWVCMVGVDRYKPITIYDETKHASLSLSFFHLKQIEQLCDYLPSVYSKIESLNESAATDGDYIHMESICAQGYTPCDEPKFQFIVIHEPCRAFLYQIPRHVFILAMILCGYDYIVEVSLPNDAGAKTEGRVANNSPDATMGEFTCEDESTPNTSTSDTNLRPSIPVLQYRFYAKFMNYTFAECLTQFLRKGSRGLRPQDN